MQVCIPAAPAWTYTRKRWWRARGRRRAARRAEVGRSPRPPRAARPGRSGRPRLRRTSAWKPPALREARLARARRDVELVLANAAHIQNVPGRKTDVNDAMWLADLFAHGLVRASFVPPTASCSICT